jgi:hypothetical protein
MRATGSLGRECLSWECGSPQSSVPIVREPTQRLTKNKKLQKEFAMAACAIPLGGVNRCG